jgi:hypothetical protein
VGNERRAIRRLEEVSMHETEPGVDQVARLIEWHTPDLQPAEEPVEAAAGHATTPSGVPAGVGPAEADL